MVLEELGSAPGASLVKLTSPVSLPLPRAWRTCSKAEGCQVRLFWTREPSESCRTLHRGLVLQELPEHL